MPNATQHLAAWTEEQNPAGVFSLVDGVPDSVLEVNGANMRVPADLTHLLAAYYGADSGLANLTARARLVSGSLHARMLADIRPLNGNTVEPAVPARWMDLNDAPVPLLAKEVLQLEENRTAAAGADTTLGLTWFGNPAPWTPPPPGAYWVAYATTAAAFTALVWNNRAITFTDKALPKGTYELYASLLLTTDGIAHRWSLPGSSYRPGWLAFDDAAEPDAAYIDSISHRGPAATFESDNLPSIDVLPNGATNEVQRGYALVRKVA